MTSLVLFTEVFPYYGRETFLEVEIKYLSKEFERVVIIPFRPVGEKMRPVPSNCIVEKGVTTSKWGMYLALLNPSEAYPIFLKDFFAKKVFCSGKKFKTWLIAFAMTNSYLHSKAVKALLKKSPEEYVFYSYWGKGGCFLAPFKKKGTRFVSRFHGEWDLWEELCGNYGPIRQMVLSNLDMVFPISNKGEAYLKGKYSINKSSVSRLGTQYHGESRRSIDGVFRIVSCSSVNPNKRVLYMLEVFSKTRIPLEWTHIGIGPEFELLKEYASKVKNENLKINILGRLPNEEIFKYYIEKPVDAFINLSKSEGIPVSIMEAISCNIPVIATNVGSTCEIVNEQTGVLLDKDPTVDDVYSAIEHIKQNRKEPLVFWKENYDADKNYKTFIELLKKM